MRRAHNHETLHSGESYSSIHTIFLSYCAKGYVGGLPSVKNEGNYVCPTKSLNSAKLTSIESNATLSVFRKLNISRFVKHKTRLRVDLDITRLRVYEPLS